MHGMVAQCIIRIFSSVDGRKFSNIYLWFTSVTSELVLVYARGVAKANKRQYVGKILYLVSRGNS